MTAVNAVLNEDRAAREKDRWTNIGGGLSVALLCPALLWCAAYGITPLVRGGYALMAAGTAILVSTGWMYLGLGPASLARASGLALAVAEERIPPDAPGQPDENGTTMVRALSS